MGNVKVGEGSFLFHNSTVTSHIKRTSYKKIGGAGYRRPKRKKRSGYPKKDPIETQLLTRGLEATQKLEGLNVEVQN